MDFIDLIIHAYVFVILFIAYLALHRAESYRKRDTTSDKKEFVISSPQLKQALDDADRANEISENVVRLLVDVKKQVNEAVTDITDLKQSLNSVKESAETDVTSLKQLLSSVKESTDKFDRILFDPQAKGALGEKFVADQLSILPAGWVRRNVPFPNDTHVEFCVLTYDQRLIPIDSKWPGTRLLDLLGQTTNTEIRRRIKEALKAQVYKRGLEVTKYLDDDRTVGFGIAAVPDSVFALCVDVQPHLAKKRIVLVSYSLLVPYILLLVKLFLADAQGVRAMQISQILESALAEIAEVQELIDTDLRKPLDIIKQQQSDYHSLNESLQEANGKIAKIQNELDSLSERFPKSVATLANSDISSIPNDLKHRVSELRKSLAETKAKQNGHVPPNMDPEHVENGSYESS